MNKTQRNILAILALIFVSIGVYTTLNEDKTPTQTKSIQEFRNLNTQDPFVRQFYNELPMMLWELPNKQTLTNEEVKEEVTRLQFLLRDKLPFIPNKFKWLTENLPVTVINTSDISYNASKYNSLNRPGRMSNLVNMNDALDIINLDIDSAKPMIKVYYDKAQEELIAHINKSFIIDLANSLNFMPKNIEDFSNEDIVKNWASSKRIPNSIYEVFPNFTYLDFIVNKEVYLKKMNITEHDLRNPPELPNIPDTSYPSQNDTNQEFERKIFTGEIQ